TGAATRFTTFFAWNLNGGFHPAEGFFERDLEVETQVAAAHGPPASSPSAAKAEEVTEDVGEVAEDVRVHPRSTLRGTCHGGMTKLVVPRTFVRIGEHRVGLGRFLELLLSLGIVLIAIGMMLQRKLA